MRWIQRIDAFHHRLSKQDMAILTYLEKHKASLSQLTMADIATACFVSRSSISRLLKKLELDTFAEMKYLIQQEETRSLNLQTDFNQVVQRYHTYIDQIFEKQDLSQVVSLLVNTDTLYLYGTGNAQKLEVESFRQLMTSVGKKVVIFFDKGEYDYLKENFTNQDLLLLLSYKGEATEAISILKDAKLREITSLVMTQTSHNTMAKLADFQLYVPTESIKTPTRLTYEVSTTFYFIIDQLFFDYCQAMGG